uniref:ATP synthase F0 subunit 8 n=1 Tax=Metacrangonyx sp. 2 MDMBR-2012 TaxID=1200661 RepID=K7ZVZ6_9CRUS|nr:ATP synthase F0 subunit 8 [Metacrangonyx sp. 2 MDMBR-2012]
MPQMAPSLWLVIYIFMFFMIVFFNNFLFFFNKSVSKVSYIYNNKIMKFMWQ